MSGWTCVTTATPNLTNLNRTDNENERTAKMIFTAALLTSCVKLLLIPAYKSTDFEVHRNWLAITHSLPIRQWYFEATSEWTLDYPPLFAYFEYLLSLVAALFDEKMLSIENLNHDSGRTVLFQRLSVIVTDLVYIYGVRRVCGSIQRNWRSEVVLPILLVANCGLLMVDHIHFQYNGFLYGILLMSIADMLQGNHIRSALWFTILLNLKHIYVYMAPAYFVYLLQNYCLKAPLSLKTALSPGFAKRILLLGSVVVGTFLLTFAPFYDHLGQVLSRLFPFKRGLCHAYWAPNVWAVYNVADKALFMIGKTSGLISDSKPVASMTGGLVQEFSHQVLPDVKPIYTVILTAIAMLPALAQLWRCSGKQPGHNFLRCLVLCALTSFLFGWHVHEKAILMAIIPLSILSVIEAADAKFFVLLATVGHYALFPLLFPSSLAAVKCLLLLVYTLYTFHSLYSLYSSTTTPCRYALPLLNPPESLYVLGLLVLFVFDTAGQHWLGLSATLPFLSLMATSVYCSVGVTYCWVGYYANFLRRGSGVKGTKAHRKGQ